MAQHDGLQVLPSGAGYGIVVGIGGFFALVMLGITWMQNRYTRYSTTQSEEFNTASRSVKPGLIASGIVSSWTWSATLLTSSTFAYSYGVCGPMWYGAMGTFQILMFALIAIKIKANAPGAHTFPEILLAKHGKYAHLTYLFNGLATNMLVGACLVLGGSQVVAALTGMNVYAACFLIPLVVAVYVIAGGLRSTFIADYIHTVILFLAIFVFGFLIYATSDLVGSPGKLYDLLIEASERMPIAKNAGEGSYLAFRSVNGLVFAIDLLAAGFSTVWLDQAYWQRAIASRPETSVRAYILGGVAWYGIPFGFATAMGLGCAALTGSERFPTYPEPLSAAQVAQGLSSPATAIALLGKGGAVLMLILLFMAVTSSTSAELIAVSSLLTFDIYKTYISPLSSPAKLVKISHYSIIIYALALATFCSILNAVGLNLTWLLTVLAIIVGGAAVPVGLALLWDGKMSSVAAVASPWIGLCCGLIAWFVTTWKRSGGVISVATTGDTTNAVAGNVASLGVGAVMAVVLSYVFPGKFESSDARHVERSNKIMGIVPLEASGEPSKLDDGGTVATTGSIQGNDDDGEEVFGEEKKTQAPLQEPPLDSPPLSSPSPSITTNQTLRNTTALQPMDPTLVKKSERLARVANILFILLFVLLIPFSLFGTGYVYSKGFFTGWVVVSFLWVWGSMVICVVWPIVESWGSLGEILGGMGRDVRGGVLRGKGRGGGGEC